MPPEIRPEVANRLTKIGGLIVATPFEGRDELEAVVAGLPAMADIIAAMPDGQRLIALPSASA
jgi:hypothetical protein